MRTFGLRLTAPEPHRAAASRAIGQVLAATGLTDWFDWAVVSGPWALWWDDALLWTGSTADPEAWTQALLEGWWGQGGGCC